MTTSPEPENSNFPITIDEITIDYYCEGPGGTNGIDVFVGDWAIQIPLEDSDQVIAAIVKAQIELKSLFSELPPVETVEGENG